jgi:hypothetical protein
MATQIVDHSRCSNCEVPDPNNLESEHLCSECAKRMRLYDAAETELRGFVEQWAAKYRSTGLTSYQLRDHLASAEARMHEDAKARNKAN